MTVRNCLFCGEVFGDTSGENSTKKLEEHCAVAHGLKRKPVAEKK